MSPGAARAVRGRLLSRFIVSCGPSNLVPPWEAAPDWSAALPHWLYGLQKLDVSVNGSESGTPASSSNEEMLDWLVVSVRSGWTSRVVFAWFFLVFGDLMFQMIFDSVEEI